MDAISLLREDHRTVLALLDELEGGLAGRGRDPERQQARARLDGLDKASVDGPDLDLLVAKII